VVAALLVFLSSDSVSKYMEASDIGLSVLLLNCSVVRSFISASLDLIGLSLSHFTADLITPRRDSNMTREVARSENRNILREIASLQRKEVAG